MSALKKDLVYVCSVIWVLIFMYLVSVEQVFICGKQIEDSRFPAHSKHCHFIFVSLWLADLNPRETLMLQKLQNKNKTVLKEIQVQLILYKQKNLWNYLPAFSCSISDEREYYSSFLYNGDD